MTSMQQMIVFVKNGLFPASFLFIFVFSTANSTFKYCKFLPMHWIEPRIYCIGNNRSTNWAATNALKRQLFVAN